MHKIPMSETVSGAYSFTFKNILSIIGIAWFPWAVCLVLIGLGVYAAIPNFEGLREGTGDPAAFGSLFALIGLGTILMTVVASMVNVGVLRQALGLHKGQVFIYFDLGGDVWRLIGALLLTALAVYGVLIVLVLVMVLIFTAGAQAMGQGLATTLGVIGSIVACCLFIYMFVRLVFFVAPVVVAERRISLGRAWELGAGNFWRIVGIWIAVTLPAGFAFNMIVGAFMGQPPIEQLQQATTPEEIFAIYGQMFAGTWPILAVLYLLYIIILTGLINGAQAVAYKLVTSPPQPKAPAPAA